MEVVAEKRVYEFGDFRLETAVRILSSNQKRVSLKPKALDILIFLIENRERIVSKDEIFNTIWNNQFVEEGNLTVHISALRKALGENNIENPLIVTYSGKGYQFVGEVREISKESKSLLFNSPKSAIRKKVYLFFSALVVAGILFGTVFYLQSKSFVNKATKFPNIKFSRFTNSGNIELATLSSDGKFVVFIKKENGGESLWLKQTSTGSETNILPVEDIEYLGLTVSPDENYIYCSVLIKNKADTPVFRVPLLGGKKEDLNYFTNSPVAFSPDGSRIAITHSSHARHATYIYTMKPDGSDQELLTERKEPDVFQIYKSKSLAWSPDGKQIAAITQSVQEEGIYKNIILVNAENGVESVYHPSRWNDISEIVWLPDQTGLLLTGVSETENNSQVWFLPNANGDAQRLTNDLNNYSAIGIAKESNKILTIVENIESKLLVSDSKIENAIPKILVSETNLIGSLDFAQDEQIFYTSSKSGKNEIWAVNIDGTEAKQVTFDAFATRRGLAVSPDNTFIVFSSTKNAGHTIWRCDLNGNNLKQISDGKADIYPSISPDSKTVYFQRGGSGTSTYVYQVSANGGEQKKLSETQGIRPMISPSGTQLAVYFMEDDGTGQETWRIGLISLENGKLEKKIDFSEPITERFMNWTEDGKFITNVRYDNNQMKFISQSLNNVNKSFIFPIAGKTHSFSWSRENKLAIAQYEEKKDVIFLEKY